MKGVLVCPGDRPGVAFLGMDRPVVLLEALGETVMGYWLQHVAEKGWREAVILATDRPAQVQAHVEDGARWGVKVEVRPELRELNPVEAMRVCGASELEVLDHFPGGGRKIFSGYGEWYRGILEWWPQAGRLARIGFRQVRPGVWMGLRVQVDPGAELRPPCWLGHRAVVGKGAVIGPEAVLEDGVVVDHSAEIAYSVAGAGTYVGSLTRLKDSLAKGSLLVNWRTGSCTEVPDSFLLCQLSDGSGSTGAWNRLGRLAAGMGEWVKRPLAGRPGFVRR